MRAHWFLLTAAITSIVTPLSATSVRRLSFEELIQTASTIVEGSVVDSRTYRSGDGKLILTSYTINVQENLKGASGSTLTVTTVGGRIGNTILHVAGVPAFQPGEKAVLFLEKTGTYTTVVGLNQGKFAISNGAVSNNSAGLSFPDGGPATPLKMPLDEFKRQIKLHSNRLFFEEIFYPSAYPDMPDRPRFCLHPDCSIEWPDTRVAIDADTVLDQSIGIATDFKRKRVSMQ